MGQFRYNMGCCTVRLGAFEAAERTPIHLRKSRRKQRKSGNKNQFFDIVGIVLLFLWPITLISLLAPDTSGVIGHSIKAGLTGAVGIGAYVFPFLSALIGIMFIVGPITVWSRNAGLGGALLFLVFITWMALSGLKTVPIEESGGVIGWLIALGLERTVGALIGKILLVLSGVIGLYVAFDVPLASIVGWLRNALGAGGDAARERLLTAAAPKRNGSKGAAKVKKSVLSEEENGPKPKRRLLPILVRKGDREAEVEPVKPDHRRIPVTVGHTPTKPAVAESDESEAEHGEFRLPPVTLLADPQPPPPRVEAELRENVEIIERTLEEFKVSGDVVEIAHGPTITRYEIRLAAGIKVNKIVNLADNLAMSLAAIDVRVEAPIPGKSAIGVEVPNKHAGIVGLRDVVDTDVWQTNASSKLSFALGKDVAGDIKLADLTKMPHMLISGATNSGKSICLNTLIASLLFRCTPDELKMILIDPKRVELSLFDGIPHLACPVVRDARQAAGIFRAATKEMDNRYELIARSGSRNIQSYNEKMPEGERLPYLVIVVDELADLMMQAAAEVETSICRLAQLARAVGIHLIIATQRPSVDVVTGLIKANISSRIAFAVSSQVDSRTIIDQNGAERLIGRGDMLYLPIDAQKPLRVQGCYLAEDEIHRLVEFLKEQRKPVYTIEAKDITASGRGEDDGGMTDELYEQAVRMIVTSGYASTSMIQRKFKIGYTRAARIVDAMEQQGIVGPLDGSKPREVLVDKQNLDKLFGAPLGMGYADDGDEDLEDE